MAAAPAAVVFLPALASGSSSTPVGLTPAVEEDAVYNESSLDSFGGMGTRMSLILKLMGLLPTMSHLTIYVILSILLGLLALGFHWNHLPPSSHTGSFMHCPPLDTSSTPDTLVLSPGLVSTLLKVISLEILGAALCMAVADSGATNHMLPDRAAFISYKSVCNLCVCMGNNSYAPILHLLLEVQGVCTTTTTTIT
jgi:hypothetical protein